MMATLQHQTRPTLPTPVEVFNPAGRAPLLLVCEHASNSFPPAIGDLGLTADQRTSHIAWDPGAGAVTRALAQNLDARAVLGTLSRLLYDLNRPPEAPDAIPARSENHRIRGNADLDPRAASHRIAEIYTPFTDRLAAEIATLPSPPSLVTVHSFTPVYAGTHRTTQIGILHDTDSRLADAMLATAAAHTDLLCERNRPYSAADGVTHTLRRHALPAALPNVMIEIRNDLIATPESQAAMAALLARWLRAALLVTPGAQPCPI